MNPLFKLFGIYKIFEEYNINIQRLGWPQASKKLLDSLGIRTEVKLDNFPDAGAILVYANHPTGLDPFMISSFFAREDIYCLCDIYQTQKGTLAAKHIIPVYYWKFFEFIYKPLTAWPGYFVMRLKSKWLSRQEAGEKNIKSLKKIVDILRKDGVVVVFPSGGEMAFRPWKSGVGLVIKNLDKRKVNYHLYQVKIGNLTEVGLIWHFISGRRYYAQNPVTVTGRETKLLSNIIRNNSTYSLAQVLKEMLYQK